MMIRDMEFSTCQLDNGIRIIHKQVNSEVAHCGLLINAGSRDEKEHEHGMAHFIEHALFKGTRKRKAFHILSRLEDVGGELNAYTTKEETCIHSSFLKNDYERSLELIHDITFNSIFPGKEINREKEVIIEEINSYNDDPAELIFDDFEEIVFKNQPLGKNILGTPQLLKKFSREDIESFIHNNYHTDEMVIASVGNIEFSKLIKLIKKHFNGILLNERNQAREKFENYIPDYKVISKNTHQSHCIIGNIAYSATDKRKYAMTLLDNIIGGPGMNSRISMLLREKLGYAYHIESNYTAYSDTGIFSLYFGTEKNNLQKSIKQVYKEFEKLRTLPLGDRQLKKAKRQLFGQTAIGAENNLNLMLSIGKSYLNFNRVHTLKEIHNQIESITAEDVRKVAEEILDPTKLSTLIYQ